MATQETQVLDNIIASRRALLMGGGAALALALAPSTAKAAATVTAYTDADILNFALNLEYLEANFYYLAAFGTNIYSPNPLYAQAGAAVMGITGTGTQGIVVAKANPKVPFTSLAIASYAIETAVEEGKHVSFLRGALGSAAVAQPQIDLNGAWNTLANAAGLGTTFDPFASDATFLLGAYVFEDVGVTAYHGAAPLLSQTAAGKGNLLAAASIHAVEAYHAGLVRTSILFLDNANGNTALSQAAIKISTLRNALAKNPAVFPATPDPFAAKATVIDDYGVSSAGQMVSLGGSTVPATQIVDASPDNVIAYARTTSQVLNIVTGGGAQTAGVKSTGVFFPAGLNGTFI